MSLTNEQLDKLSSFGQACSDHGYNSVPLGITELTSLIAMARDSLTARREWRIEGIREARKLLLESEEINNTEYYYAQTLDCHQIKRLLTDHIAELEAEARDV